MTKPRNETLPPLSVLSARIKYDPETGSLTWKSCGKEHFDNDRAWRIWHGKFAGKPVRKMTRGYVIVSISYQGKTRYCFGHRVAWALMTGEWPKELIDHIDQNKSNNAWSNLRLATHQQNQWNKGSGVRNKSGFVGVHRHTQNPTWVAQIAVNGRTVHLGSFGSAEAAAKVRREAELRAHGQFASGAST